PAGSPIACRHHRRCGPLGPVVVPFPPMRTRVDIVQDRLIEVLSEATPGGPLLAADDTLADGLSVAAARDLLADMLTSRWLDVAARRLKVSGNSYYPISSAGHEANAVIGAATRATDPAFLHYRSGGFVMARSRQVRGIDAIGDTIRSFTAAA